MHQLRGDGHLVYRDTLSGCQEGMDSVRTGRTGLGVLTWARNLHLDSASYSQCDLDSPVHLSEPQSPPL